MQGTYVLFIKAKRDIKPTVGKLGNVRIGKGIYAYVGSAMGKSVNLENRVKRHQELARNKKGNKQWHIDYITTSRGIEISGVVKINGKAIECEVAKLLGECGGRAVADGLGSSDCRCRTHFFSITEEVAENMLRQLPDLF